MRKKSINTFALLVILMIAVPEVIGHTLFDRGHSPDSSVKAAMLQVSKISKDPKYNLDCKLTLESDPSGSTITRAAGLEGKYGNYYCG